MTRQHFMAIADVLGRENANQEIVAAFVRLLRETNSAFDQHRFIEAVTNAGMKAGWQNSYHVRTVLREQTGI